jgi:hypothetical protein
LPHSEIPGSPIARISPGLVAACHVLHRLSVPRHPPDALASRLITRHPARNHGRTTRCHTTAAHRAKTPHPAASHEDASSDTRTASLPHGVSASVTSQLSLFTLQSTPASHPTPASHRRNAVWLFAKHPQSADGGGERIRTDDLLLAKQALSQLSYTPSETTSQGSAVSDKPGAWLLVPGWWAREDLNLRPHAYQARALTS